MLIWGPPEQQKGRRRQPISGGEGCKVVVLKWAVGVGFEIQSTHGSGTWELLRGPRGGPGGSESLALGGPGWTPEHAGNLTSGYSGKWAFLSAS